MNNSDTSEIVQLDGNISINSNPTQPKVKAKLKPHVDKISASTNSGHLQLSLTLPKNSEL